LLKLKIKLQKHSQQHKKEINMRAFAKRPDKAELEKIEKASLEVVTGRQTTANVAAPVLAPAQDRSASYTHLKVGDVADVPTHVIKRNPVNARRVTSQSGLDEFAQKLKDEGQQAAAQAYIDSDGSVNLIAGHRRLEGCIIAGIPTLRIEIRPQPENEQQLYLQSRAENTDRENQTPIDDALAWKLLLERKIFASQVALAEALKVDQTVVSRILKLADMPKPLINMLAERPTLMNLRMLDAINRFLEVAGEEETEKLLIEIVNKDLSSRDVDAKRASIQAGPVSRTRGHTQTLKFEKGKTIIKRFEGQGRLVLEINDVKDEKIIALINTEFQKILEQHLK
jgi:ParB family transcriptional regulator, chromosome partitioning protein